MRIIRYSLLFLIVLLVVTASGQTLRIPPNTTETSTLTVTQPSHGVISGWGISCGTSATDCTESFLNFTTVTITATPDSGATFTSWGGACAGSGSTCTLTMSQARSVTATFTVTTAEGPQLYVSNIGTGGSNLCTTNTDAGACHLARAREVAQCGSTINLRDGVYTGLNHMFDTHNSSLPNNGYPANPNCSLGNEITVRAINDGAVTFDGQAARPGLVLIAMSYWKFAGFNVTNAPDDQDIGTNAVNESHHITFQRICVSNVNFVPPYVVSSADASRRGNIHVWANNGSSFITYEDFCAFGTGRVMMNERDDSHDNTYRRVWIRYEGWYSPASNLAECGGGVALQNAYATHQLNTRYENIISIFSWERIPATGLSCYNPTTKVVGYQCSPELGNCASYMSVLQRDSPYPGEAGYQYRGFVGYEYDLGANNQAFQQGSSDKYGGEKALNIRDMFLDMRTTTAAISGPMRLGCLLSSSCTGNIVDRVTSIRMSGQPSSDYNGSPPFTWPQGTNLNEGTDITTLPNFYTGNAQGGGSGPGARNCFEYTDGVLGSTATQRLWPWRMDDRIKAALAYERAAGRGGTALSGAAGTGYAANTVTSEIVSRYGAVPSQCLR